MVELIKPTEGQRTEKKSVVMEDDEMKEASRGQVTESNISFTQLYSLKHEFQSWTSSISIPWELIRTAIVQSAWN